MKIDEFESYTKHINLIRNLCAHNMPIIDINIKTPPKIPSEVKYLVNNPRKLITSILIGRVLKLKIGNIFNNYESIY